MHPEIGKEVQKYSDEVGREISSEEVYTLFEKCFVNPEGRYELVNYWPRPDDSSPTLIHGEVKIMINGKEEKISSEGNGPVSAFVNCLRQIEVNEFKVDNFEEQAIGHGADAIAMAYVPIKLGDGATIWGVGKDTNIDQAAIKAIIAGLNRANVK
jgi:2-isopropylmalate synthase